MIKFLNEGDEIFIDVKSIVELHSGRIYVESEVGMHSI